MNVVCNNYILIVSCRSVSDGTVTRRQAEGSVATFYPEDDFDGFPSSYYKRYQLRSLLPPAYITDVKLKGL